MQPSPTAISRGALTALLLFAPPIGAQSVESTLDLGAVTLRYADTLYASAATLTPRIVADWGRALVDASGTYSQFASGGWSTQGALSGSLFAPILHGVLPELAAFAGGSTHHDGTRTGQVLANGRLHFVGSGGEIFLGAGAGRTWVGGGSRSVLLGEAGVSATFSDVGATFTANPTVVEDSIKYLDAQWSLSWARERLELGALVGTRLGNQLTALGGNTRSWGSLSAVRWMTHRLALVASGGTYPIDPTQGFPGGRFVSLSLRVAARSAHVAVPLSAPKNHTEMNSPEILPVLTRFAAERTATGVVTLKVDAPRARVVEVSGDFTSWMPVSLARTSDGSWAVTLPIRRGKYQMNVRLDGGKWLVPPGLLPMVDEFGGSVGLLIIE
ncbi:MAG TPA: glycogen-binding domain-containing protein [Gemmatimonadaceae bacterium]|nr:glycogen-binding domain-containing protein [Gemmatimonadaceae bacterium]